MRLRILPLLVLASTTAVVTGCATAPVAVPLRTATVAIETTTGAPAEWRETARAEDASRIALIDATWAAAIAEARVRHARTIDGEGALFTTGTALPRAQPSPGRYRCRTYRVGMPVGRLPSRADTRNAFVRYKSFYCFVGAEGSVLTFTKGTGTRRPGGRFWPDGDERMIFLGAVADRESDPVPPYGVDDTRDLVGVLQRIDDFRWRLVIPGREGQPRIEVIELVPDVAPSSERVQ